MGHYDRYWEMREGGPYAGEPGQEDNRIFKCRDCGAETHHRDGWDGEPDPGRCAPWCPSRNSDWRPGRVSNRFRENFDRIRFRRNGGGTAADRNPRPDFRANFDAVFPAAPGAGI